MFFSKKKTNLNKCDYCDLHRIIQPRHDEIQSLDKWFSDIHELYQASLIPHKYSKRILIPENTTSYCLINSKYWHNKNKKCPYWQATVGSSSDAAMSLHYTRQTKKLTSSIYILTAIMAILAIHPWLLTIIKAFQECLK